MKFWLIVWLMVQVPRLAAEVLHLDHMGVDGSLYLVVPLTELRVGQRSCAISLRHEIGVDSAGGGYSQWVCPDLDARLVRVEGDAWEARAPGLAPARFTLKPSALAGWIASDNLKDIRLRSIAPGRFEVMDQDGYGYLFHEGRLVAIETLERRYDVHAPAGRIVRIADGERIALEVEYDRLGRIESMDTNGRRLTFGYLDGTKVICRVREADGKARLAVDYRANLATRVTLDETRTMSVAWKPNPYFRSGSRQWARPPVIVQAVDDREFDYRISGPVLTLSCRSRSDESPVRLRINTLNGQLLERTSSDGTEN